MSKIAAGVDIGSTTAKCVTIVDDKIITGPILPTGANPSKAGEKALKETLIKLENPHAKKEYVVATGYGRINAPFANITVTEISCHGRGAHYLDPDIHTVIDIGGQDFKAIALGNGGKIIDFALNDKCAAGTGRFLEFASRLVLEVSLEEMGELSMKAKNPAEISSTCTVFALTEIVSLLAEGATKEDVIAGLHNAISQRVAVMAKKVGLKPAVMLTGGVSKNSGLKKSLSKELGINIYTSEKIDPQLVGALGAAIIAKSHLEND
jgi:predicted CoA-substrate-specific enzyme activase